MPTSKIRLALGSIAAAGLLMPAAADAHVSSARPVSQHQLQALVAHTVAAKPVIDMPRNVSVAAAPSAAQVQNDLIFHGGSVLHKPKAYLIFYGSQWDSPSTITAGGVSYTLGSAENYLKAFFSGIGGSPWMGVTTQYCDNVLVGTVDCSTDPGADHITNPKDQLAGVWVDDSAPAPTTIVTTGLAENAIAQDPIATEAEKATLHFGYDPEAVYMVFTPPGVTATAYGSVYCAYHNQASTITRARQMQYAFMPYVPEQGSGCRNNSVFKTDDAFGHGYYDSYSITAGHEYAEAVTDPGNFFSAQDGWNDNQTSENGDKCANVHLQAITLPAADGTTTQKFAVQPTWSNAHFDAGNADKGCAVN